MTGTRRDSGSQNDVSNPKSVAAVIWCALNRVMSSYISRNNTSKPLKVVHVTQGCIFPRKGKVSRLLRFECNLEQEQQYLTNKLKRIENRDKTTIKATYFCSKGPQACIATRPKLCTMYGTSQRLVECIVEKF